MDQKTKILGAGMTQGLGLTSEIINLLKNNGELMQIKLKVQ